MSSITSMILSVIRNESSESSCIHRQMLYFSKSQNPVNGLEKKLSIFFLFIIFIFIFLFAFRLSVQKFKQDVSSTCTADWMSIGIARPQFTIRTSIPSSAQLKSTQSKWLSFVITQITHTEYRSRWFNSIFSIAWDRRVRQIHWWCYIAFENGHQS